MNSPGADGSTSGLLRQTSQARTSRRAMLRRGGVAAAVSLAGLTMLDQRRAEAATGGNFVLGAGNDADNTTTLSVTTAGTTLNPLFYIDGSSLSSTSTTLLVDSPPGAQGVGAVVNGSNGGLGMRVNGSSTSSTVGLALLASGNGSASGVAASSGSGTGVQGSSTSGTGVQGSSTSGTGVQGSSTSGTGIQGSSSTGNGISGSSTKKTGVAGTSTSGTGTSGASASGTGVAGSSKTGYGVHGSGSRGGVFEGSSAQLRLTPASKAHPHSGSPGDLYVDHNHHLWFCKGSTDWVKLA
jgi:hypothetical protein